VQQVAWLCDGRWGVGFVSVCAFVCVAATTCSPQAEKPPPFWPKTITILWTNRLLGCALILWHSFVVFFSFFWKAAENPAGAV